MGLVEKRIGESIETKRRILDDGNFLRQIQEAADMIWEAVAQGRKILFCGNGGSASDAIHLTGEFVGRFQKERQPLAAIALNSDVAVLTAIANDYGYDSVFSRAVKGLMNRGDVLVGLSTSGSSENIYRGMVEARMAGGNTVAMLGNDGGKIRNVADIAMVVPSGCTARIQEAHIMIGHIVCELVENRLSSEG